MHHPHHFFRINIGFIINKPIGSSREYNFENAEYFIPPDIYFNELEGVAILSRIQQGLRIYGDFHVNVTAKCARCLQEFQLPLHTNFEEIFTFKTHPLSENEQIIPNDGYIDLEKFVSDCLLLQIPINPLCKKDCKGLCSVCGQNLNYRICEHYKKTLENN